MPIKVHVKGKRRAPLPPIKAAEPIETAPAIAATAAIAATTGFAAATGIAAATATATATVTTISQTNFNIFPIPNLYLLGDSKAKKKVAPTPPNATNDDQCSHTYLPLPEDVAIEQTISNLNTTTNNLSGCNSPGKLSRKKYDNNIFFNIIGASKSSSDKYNGRELVEANRTDKSEPILKNFRSHMDLVENGVCNGNSDGSDDNATTIENNDLDRLRTPMADDTNTLQNRNLLVWNCQYCTFENPFWKIVCSVCDNMKPYDLPSTTTTTTTSTATMATTATMAPATTQTTDALNLETKQTFGDQMYIDKDNNKNQQRTNDMKIDNLAIERDGSFDSSTYDEIYSTGENENATSNISPYAVEVVYRKKINNKDADNAIKRNSEIIIKDYPTNTLEMEKQRLRAVIRNMNNRALAEKYPVPVRNAISLNNAIPIASINRADTNGRKTPDYAVIDEVLTDVTKSGAIRKTELKNSNNAPNSQNRNRLPHKNDDAALANSNYTLATDPYDSKEKITKVSTSVQTDTFIKTIPVTYAVLQDVNANARPMGPHEYYQGNAIATANPAQSSSASAAVTSRTAVETSTLNLKDLPDACYEYIGNLSMYGDQDVFTNTLKKLENAFSDNKTGEGGQGGDGDGHNSTFVKMNVSNLKLSMNIPKPAIPHEKSILVNLYINFNNAIEIDVQPSMLLSQLKNKIAHELMPSMEQRIYFNGLLMDKEKTLKEYGIKEKSSIYLNTEDVKVDVENAIKNGAIIPYVGDGMKFIKNDLAPSPPVNNNYNRNDYQNRPSTSGSMNALQVSGGTALPTMKPTKSDEALANQNDVPNYDQYRIEHTQLNRISIEKINSPPANPNITKNKYRGVYNYNPRYNPALVIEGEPYLIRIKDEAPKRLPAPAPPSSSGEASNSNAATVIVTTAAPFIEPLKSHYLELLSLDNLNDIATNTESFDCAICFLNYGIGEGVVLRECLHAFCKDCIRSTIIYSEEAEVRCPYIDASYTCECALQDREIKSLLTKEEHDDHLAKSLRVAENKIKNSFHCRTPNCKGWCIYEDNVNQFRCPICSLVNCLTCRVIHDGLDCKQYQENAKNEEGNSENHTTKKMLDEMVENGEAMFCPTCRVVLMKKWGCDWLKCSMCKTEICWVTRGPRWGPAGKGDTSGGCKCGVNGFKCHPKCNYCH